MMDIKIDINPIKEKRRFDDNTKYGLYYVFIDGIERGQLWLSDDELDMLREDHDVGLMPFDR